MDSPAHREPIGLAPDDLSDWPGSPLSTLHAITPVLQRIRAEEAIEDGRYIIRFELPGIDPAEGLKVTVAAGILTVQAERPDKTGGRRQSEFRYGVFSRHVTLPAGVNENDVSASYDNGILKVSVGMKGAKEPTRRIPVTASGRGEKSRR